MSTNVYVSSVAWNAVTPWAASTAYTLGQYVRQLAAPGWGNERVFKVTTAGTSGATEPTWNKANNATTVDGTVTWTQVAGQEAEQLAGNWRAPLASIATATGQITAGNGVQVYVGSDHSETDAAGMTINAANCNFVCSVSRTGASLPPTSADYVRGAKVATSGTNNLTFQNGSFYGIDFTAGTGTGASGFQFGSGNNSALYCDDCTFTFGSTGGGSIGFNSTSSFPGAVRVKSSNITFSGTGQTINLNTAATIEWEGGTWNGTSPTNIFSFPSNTPMRAARFHGIDLSALASSLMASGNGPWGEFEMWDCKLSPSIIMPTTKFAADQLSFLRVVNCDDATSGRNYRFFHLLNNGYVQSDTQVIRTGGASDGVTSFSHKFTSSAFNGNGTPAQNCVLGWISRRYATLGVAKTLTLEAICFPFGGYALNLNDLWIEVEVLDTAGAPLGHLISTKGSILGGAGSAATSSSAWDSAAPARANSTAYAAFSAIKVASNPGRVFTNYTGAAGTSAASEPAGFATCVDGGTVTDGGNTWKCGTRLKFQQSITPQVAGIVRARLVTSYGGGTNQPFIFYFDPKLSIA